MSTPEAEAVLIGAVVDAQADLAVRVGDALVDPSAANIAAVKALQERVVSAEQALNDWLALHGQAANPITPAPVIYGINTGPELPPPPTTPIPVPGANNQDTLNPTVITGTTIGALSGEDSAIGNYDDQSADETTAENGWSYLRDQVEDVFKDLEDTLDDVTGTGFGVETGVSLAEIGAGVTADLADLPVVGFALALLLGEYAFGWILQQVGQFFPNPSIFGFHPLDFLRAGLTDVGNNIAGAAEAQATTVANVLIQPVRMLVGLFQRVVNAVAGAHDKTARIVQNTVPSAAATTLAEAKAYTDEQQDAVSDAAQQALINMNPPPTVAQAKVILQEAAQYGTLVWQLEAVAAAAIVSAGTYTDDTKTQTEADIAAAKAAAESDAQNAITNMENTLIARLTGDETTLSALATEVNTTIPEEIATKIQEGQAAEDQALSAQIASLQGQVTTIQGQIASLTAANDSAQANIVAAQQEIATLEEQGGDNASAIAAQQAIIATNTATITTNTTAISDLETQITAISDTLAPIQALQQLQTSQISGLTNETDVILPAAIATVATSLQALQTQVDTCSVDNCDTANPNNIRNVLKGLLSLLTDAAEIGFIAEAINDPMGTANALAPLLDSIDATAVATLNTLLSL